MNNSSKSIYVYADWPEKDSPVKMGCLNVDVARGKEIFSFEFTSAWLRSESARMLDPDLQFYPGRQYADREKNNFGIFLDSSPDRWGRQLIRRHEAISARRERRPARPLLESDYLLGVHDTTRMGALRFKLDESRDFVNNDSELPAPPWSSLNELESACRHYEDESGTDDEHDKWLAMLLAPGSSLGGARPKANVLDNDKNLWIAKFPSREDAVNMGAWEMVAHELAKSVGLKIPECRMDNFSRHGSTFLSRRFDRKSGRRIHFASAMTLLGRMDGENHETGCCYLDLAQFIIQHGSSPAKDLEELWKRIVFNVAVSNTDDHLRNHGFLLMQQGWTLSPAYDINPNSLGGGLTLNISSDDNSLDFDLALSVAPKFHLDMPEAKSFVNEIRKAVGNWNKIALGLKIHRREIESMSTAFHT
ncbi:MAG TPA: toxin HipA [Lentisphaeria bacterium]|nr:MAG: toxin HipA [Lentisphaerae bacterium GWF2_50_93]HCE46553.1 toxin HipA [Lentisphaeria bacterium]